MKKRLLAVLCMMVMVVGIFAMVATSANAAETVTYEAGYAKKSLMPWSDGVNGTSTTLSGLGLPMSGYSNAEDRLGSKYFDDNGDGSKDRGDGIFATCTVLTEKVGSAEGKTLVFFSVDMLNGYDKLTADVRQQVVETLKTINPSCNINASQIMVSGSHTHTGPYIDSLKGSSDTDRADYYNTVVNQMVTAAAEAYESKATADMKRGSVDVSDAIGYQMNWIRHYNIPYKIKKGYTYIATTLETGTLIAGSNFGIFSDTTLEGSGSNKIAIYTDYGTGTESVAQANDTMELLTFEVEGADPIVLVNWRGHCDYIGGSDTLSSDYVNALRYRLENNATKFGGESDYRVSYIQGASGNINIMHPYATKNTGASPWLGATIGQEYVFSASSTTKGIDIIKYGYMLGNAAVKGLEEGFGTWVDCAEGAIHTRQVKYYADKHVYTDGEREAAKAYFAAGGTASFPYKYQHTDGKYYNLNSTAHAAAVLNYGEFPEEELQAVKTWKETYGLTDTENIPAILGSNTYARYAYSALSKTRTSRAELNTIMLGDSIAMVSFPGEMFDRYDADGSMSEDSLTSGWASLVGDTYGAPFVLGYSNSATGYIPNTAAYSYNSDKSTTYAPGNLVGLGAYEANTSVYAEGEGEEVIAKFKYMLSITSPTTMYCQHCDKDAEFMMIDQESVNTSLPTGHYYLGSNISLSTPVNVAPGEHVCLQLNGYTLENNVGDRIVNVGTSGATETAALNIMDSTNEGMIQALHQPMCVYQNGVVNMYGGTLRSTSSEVFGDKGGTLYVTHLNASFTLHGGAIYGANGATYGGAVYLWSNNATDYATFTMNGGIIYGGTADYGAAIGNLNSIVNINGGTVVSGNLNDGGAGNCVFIGGSVGVLNISGEPEIDHVYLRESATVLNATGDFAGQITNGITYKYKANWADGDVLGTCASGAEINATVRVYGVSQTNVVYLDAEGESLVASASDPNSHAATVGGTPYNTLDEAIAASPVGDSPANTTNYVKLNKDYTNKWCTINKEAVYLDLNGYDLKVNVNAGCTLYVMDTTTDDYNSPSANSYGKLTVSGKGEVKAVPAGSGVIKTVNDKWYSGYVMLENGKGQKSFHRVDLGIDGIDTAPDRAGIRYGCSFYGDQVVANYFTSGGGTYGVAVSVSGDPGKDNVLASHAKTTYFTEFAATTGNQQNSSYISGIMKTTNEYAVNKRNGESDIFGRAYLRLSENEYVFSPLVKTSLQECYQDINDQWSDGIAALLRKKTVEFYNTFKSVMQTWNLDKIKAAAITDAEREEEETVKILTVGNSHSMDAMWMVYEVYQQRRAQDPSLPKLELGILYYSGCHLDQHVDFAKNDLPAYVYFKMNEEIYNGKAVAWRNGWEMNGAVYVKSSLDSSYPGWTSDSSYVHIICDSASAGTYVTKDGWTLYDALRDEQWDKVVLQESANYLGQSSMSNVTNGNLAWLENYVRTYSKVMPELSFHAQWAAPMDDALFNTSSDSGRVTNMDKWFGNNDGVLDEDRLAMQRLMSQRIIANSERYFANNDTYANVINSGVAIHHAFENYKGTAMTTNDNMAEVNALLYRDYTHLSDYGRLIAANLWVEELFGDGVLTANEAVTTIPSKFYVTSSGFSMTDWRKTIMINAVNYALQTPYEPLWSEQSTN